MVSRAPTVCFLNLEVRTRSQTDFHRENIPDSGATTKTPCLPPSSPHLLRWWTSIFVMDLKGWDRFVRETPSLPKASSAHLFHCKILEGKPNSLSSFLWQLLSEDKLGIMGMKAHPLLLSYASSFSHTMWDVITWDFSCTSCVPCLIFWTCDGCSNFQAGPVEKRLCARLWNEIIWKCYPVM